MAFVYTSIFDSSSIITKKDMCQLLNLDTSRTGLKFTPAEIKKAYRIRALKFHSDHAVRQMPNLSEANRDAIFNDITRAKEHLLKGEDNIWGKGLQDKAEQADSLDGVDSFISVLNWIKSGSDNLNTAVTFSYYLSSVYPLIILFSTYSNGQLNFRYLNQLSEVLGTARPYLVDFDPSAFIEYMHTFREVLENKESINKEDIKQLVDAIYPEDGLSEEKLDQLVLAINDSADAIKTLFSDEFIGRLEYILKFWPAYIANLPSWGTIMGVYFVSTLFTATNLPKFFNALKVSTEIILTYKGGLQLALLALPLLLLSTVTLALNTVFQLGSQFLLLALPALAIVIKHSLQIISALTSILNDPKKSILNIAESALTLSVYLSIELLLGAINVIITHLSGQDVVSPFIELFEQSFAKLIHFINPKPIVSEEDKVDDNLEQGLVVAAAEAANDEQHGAPDESFTFFANSGLPLHNQVDTWLNEILEQLEEHVEEHVEVAANGV